MRREPGGSAGEASSTPLEELRWNWGEAYEIDVVNAEWRARRRDGLGDWLTATTADELRNLITSDYMLKPVPRPQPEQ